MSTNDDDNLDHLAWAIKSRHSNQVSCLRLLNLFSEYDPIWKRKTYSRAAQDLTAVAFSLWRAAFLAEKTGKRAEVFSHGKSFLKQLIEDNIISYPQDKKSREWTFNYYTRNARSSLQVLNKYRPDVIPFYEGKKRNATARWEYCQQLFEESVVEFEKLLHEKKSKEDQAKEARQVRDERKRSRSRAVTLAERSQRGG